MMNGMFGINSTPFQGLGVVASPLHRAATCVRILSPFRALVCWLIRTQGGDLCCYITPFQGFGVLAYPLAYPYTGRRPVLLSYALSGLWCVGFLMYRAATCFGRLCLFRANNCCFSS